MKKLVSVLAAILFLCSVTNTHAAFVIRNDSLVTSAFAATTAEERGVWAHNQDDYSENGGHHRTRESVKAILWATGGLIFPPLGIGAIIHGQRSLKAEPTNKGMAIAAIILGSLEVVAFIIAVVALIGVILFLSSLPW